MIEKFVKLFLVGAGLVAFGIVVYLGEIEELNEECPWYRELGMGLIGGGGLFLLLYFTDLVAPRSWLTHFLKGVVTGAFVTAIGAGALASVALPALQAWELGERGVTAEVRIVRSGFTPKVGKYGKSSRYATVEIEGRPQRIPNWNGPNEGTARVVYLADDPTVLRQAKGDADLFAFLEERPGHLWTAIGTLVGLLLLPFGLYLFFSGLFGRNRELFLEGKS